MRGNLITIFIVSWDKPWYVEGHYFWNNFIVVYLAHPFTEIIRSFNFFGNGLEADESSVQECLQGELSQP